MELNRLQKIPFIILKSIESFKLSDLFIDFHNATNDDDYDLFQSFKYHLDDIKDMKEKLKFLQKLQ